jgi:hypothetical protein
MVWSDRTLLDQLLHAESNKFALHGLDLVQHKLHCNDMCAMFALRRAACGMRTLVQTIKATAPATGP